MAEAQGAYSKTDYTPKPSTSTKPTNNSIGKFASLTPALTASTAKTPTALLPQGTSTLAPPKQLQTPPPTQGMGDLKAAESKLQPLTPKASTSYLTPTQGMGDLKAAESKLQSAPAAPATSSAPAKPAAPKAPAVPKASATQKPTAPAPSAATKAPATPAPAPAPQPVVSPQEYASMPPDQLGQSIKDSADALNGTFSSLNSLSQQALQTNNADVAGVLQKYMDELNVYLDDFVKQAEDAYANGMNDPALVQGLQVIRDEAAVMKQQLDEDMNARGLSQSGLWVEATNDHNKNVLTEEQNLTSAYLSQLNANLQASLTNVLNQRTAALTQFAGIESDAELQNAQLQLEALQTSISGLSNLGQLQQSELDSQRSYGLGQQQLGIDQGALNEQIRSNQANETLDQTALNEQIRSNQASESINRTQVNAPSAPAQPDIKDQINEDAAKSEHLNLVQNSINGYRTSIGYGTGQTTPEAFLANEAAYKQAALVGRGNVVDTQTEEIIWNAFISEIRGMVRQPNTSQASGNYYTPGSAPSGMYGGYNLGGLRGAYTP